MLKILAMVGIQIKNFSTYRSDFVIMFLNIFIKLFFIIIFWMAAFSGRTAIHNYSLFKMMLYYCWIMIIRELNNSDLANKIADDIFQGKLSSILIKPISYFSSNVVHEVSRKFIRIISIFVLTMIMFSVFSIYKLDFFHYVRFNSYFLVMIVNGMMISFLLYYLLGILSFWTEMNWAFVMIFSVLFDILGGILFPLDIVSEHVLIFFKITPFYYITYLPQKMLIGQVSHMESLQIIGIQIIWILSLGFGSALLYHRGIKKYESIGQ